MRGHPAALSSIFALVHSRFVQGVVLKCALIAFTMLVLVNGTPHLLAQVTTATVSGVLTDSTDAVLPGAKVVVTNTSTQLTRETVTDGAGRFEIPQLPPGPYTLSVQMTGFDTFVQHGITLQVGDQLNIPVKVMPGGVMEEVTVTTEAPQVNTSTSTVAQVVDEKAIENLPLNGRDFSQLPLTTAGVTASRNVSTSTTMGYGAKIVMAGSRPDVTAWLMDGTNIKGITNYGTPADVSGAMLGVGAMQEFQTVVTSFNAEIGGTSGGVINMLTKSGGNAFHGESYLYSRNGIFDAWNYFDNAKQPLSKYQYGGSTGGPIVKDKTFFFVNYEGVKQSQGATVVSFVPDTATRAAVTAPELFPYLAAWPIANVAGYDSQGLGENITSVTKPTLENYFLVRVDHQLTSKQSIFARFNYDQGQITAPDALPISAYTVSVRTRYSTIQYQKIISDHFLATSKIAFNRTVLLSNTALTADASSKLFSVPDPLIATGPIMFTPWGSPMPPQLQLPGGATLFSPVSTEQFLRLQNLYQGQQAFQYIHGAHTLKFGADIEHIGYNQLASGPGQFGSFTWNTLANFECDCDATHNNKASLSSVAILPYNIDGHEPRQWVQYVDGYWLQDDWKLTRNFTLNLGLRYEPFTVPTEKHQRYATLRDWTTDKNWLTKIPIWRNPAKYDIMPRIGFAWDATGNGKTAVRGGAGIFYVDIMDTYYGTPGQVNAPFYANITTTASVPGSGTGVYNLLHSQNDVLLAQGSATSTTLNATSGKTLIEYNLKPSYETKFNLSLDRELGKGYSATAQLVAGRGYHLWRTFATNYAPSTLVNGRPYVANTSGVINPLTGQGSIHKSDAQSFYNAAVFQAKKRFGNGAQIQTSYTYAKNVDDSTSGGVSGVGNEPSTNVPDLSKSDRARSGLFQKHTFLLNGVYPLPYSTRSRAMSMLSKGWQTSAVIIANSGEPFTVTATGNSPLLTTSIPRGATALPSNLGSGTTPNGVTANALRPDYAAGRKPASIYLHPSNKKTNPYFDTSAFVVPDYGYYGNVGRNTLIGPNYTNIDFSLKRTIAVGSERRHLELTADVFNLLNHPNFSIPAVTTAVNDATGAVVTSAGKITSTVNNNFSNRQMQFSAKFTF